MKQKRTNGGNGEKEQEHDEEREREKREAVVSLFAERVALMRKAKAGKTESRPDSSAEPQPTSRGRSTLAAVRPDAHSPYHQIEDDRIANANQAALATFVQGDGTVGFMASLAYTLLGDSWTEWDIHTIQAQSDYCAGYLASRRDGKLLRIQVGVSEGDLAKARNLVRYALREPLWALGLDSEDSKQVLFQ